MDLWDETASGFCLSLVYLIKLSPDKEGRRWKNNLDVDIKSILTWGFAQATFREVLTMGAVFDTVFLAYFFVIIIVIIIIIIITNISIITIQ